MKSGLKDFGQIPHWKFQVNRKKALTNKKPPRLRPWGFLNYTLGRLRRHKCHSHDRLLFLFRFRLALMLLAIADDANKADEMTYSPETKPNRPVTNTAPVKISL
jgi:phosphopantetheinyl transferase